MARFSKKTIKTEVVQPEKTIRLKKNQVLNRANAPSYKQSSKLELVSLLLTSFAQDQFYRKANQTFDELEALIAGQEDKKFVAKALLYARNEIGMRSISHAGTAYLVKHCKGEQWTKKFVSQMIRIPQDATEIFAFYESKIGKPYPNSLKRGIALALTKFNDYQLAKYKSEGKTTSLVDVVNLCHPKYTDSLSKLMKGELKNTETWESKLSETDGDAELKGVAWETLLKENKLGYLALLRNLRNIEQQAPKMILDACAQLLDGDKMKRALIMPFQILNAIEHVSDQTIKGTLSGALEMSLQNVPKFEGRTLIALDDSGSMTNGSVQSFKSKSPIQIGSLFASMLYRTNPDSDLLLFNSSARYLKLERDLPLEMQQSKILKHVQNAGTDFNSIFPILNKKYDRIVILSDMQSWGGYHTPEKVFNAYKKEYNANPFVYAFDLQGLGTMQFPDKFKKVFCLAGFSGEIFKVMKCLEEDKEALVHKVEAIEIL